METFVKVKVVFPLCLTKYKAMKTYGDGGIVPRVINFETSWAEEP
jgi:hypothetical protein